MWHVTSSRNRTSIQAHGLDWTRIGAAPGIAGSHRPENDGIFLSADDSSAEYFVQMNNTGGPVDVWQVDGVDPDDLLDNGSGYSYLPAVIEPGRLTLTRTDIDPVPFGGDSDAASPGGAYSSSLTVTFDDGTVLRDDAARERLANDTG